MTLVIARLAKVAPKGLHMEFLRFCVVGGSGYVVNLTIYALLVGARVQVHLAAAISVGLSMSNNYLLHRAWTFRRQRGRFAAQGLRFLVVSLVSLGLNESWLTIFVFVGTHRILAEACASLLVVPVSFLGNKFWTFRDSKLRATRLLQATEPA